MRYRTFGHTGHEVPVIGQGTWNMEKDRRRSAVEAIRRGLDAGMTHVDTAEMYGSGEVEELVGEAVAGRREEVFLISKVLPQNASRRGTVQACERSLARLRTEFLDCYLLHWRGSHPLADTFAAFEELRQAGKIRSWGVSNFDEEDLAEAVRIAGEGRIACNQVLYHLKERAIEHAVLPTCEEHGIAVVAYSPFGSGRFPKSPVLSEIADARGATPHQIALAFLTRRPSLFAIPKASDPGHAADNAAAGEIELTPEEVRRLDEAFPLGPRRPGVPTL
ncbi:MAG TPA: aldo/keto reductase [Thermoanaerobaculia bacterium]|nr:aldo/keto reductase [Thermoanaerobaculia bacterium]